MPRPTWPLILAATALPVSAMAADATLEEITITSATKTERSARQTPLSVEVVTEQEIQALGADTLRDVLLQTPGVFVNPGQGQMRIRGAGPRGTLLLIDGRRVAGEASFKYEMDRIGTGTIERIEIIKGPMGVLYGSDAVGGVIHIITKQPRDVTEGGLDLRVGSAEGGQGERYSLSGDVRGSAGDTRYSASFSLIRQEPYTERETAHPQVPRDPGQPKPLVPPSQSNLPPAGAIADRYAVDTTYRTQGETLNLGGRLDRRLTDTLEAGMDAYLTWEDREGTFIGTQYPAAAGFPVKDLPVDEVLDTERLDLAGRLRWQPTEKITIKWRSYLSDYEKENILSPTPYGDLGYTTAPDGGGSCRGEVDTLSHEFNLQWTASQAHRLLLGAEYREDERTSPWFRPDRRRSTIDYTTRSVFLQDEWTLSRDTDLLLGVRHDDFSEFDGETTGSLGVQHTLSQAARLRASYAQGFRAPSAPELFVSRNTPAGWVLGAHLIRPDFNKTATELEPERSDHLEIGLDGQGPGWHYDLALFHNEIQDRIQQVQGVGYRTFANVDEARIQGLEASGGHRLTPSLSLKGALTLLDAEDQDTGRTLEFTPETLARIALEYTPGPEWRFLISADHTGDQRYTDTAGGTARWARADAYTLVNLKASWMPAALPATEFYGGLDNLLDEDIDTVLGSHTGPFLYAGLRRYF
ncbi:outer membrane receptor for ferrienterochelin and colicins [Ectothiorhodospira mobilis]|uniref:Outer membrane receptor for ferrienterochelin and colicins n=1 Tax=Ectothiorhodospira mobilis TaxID=195064 RepID=A0A1I4RI70_ECTMO|nr:TonB-dependent receptor [Ectothiorhodospira mobilis]SFM51949.1 outer membrane receptor for ferrienterochelin and colicins [Ectothiorhodospira mobilis]